jgi:hypothetical protein
MSVMAEEKKSRVKLTFEVSERARRALAIAAGGKNVSVGSLIEWMLGETMPESLRMADEFLSQGADEIKPRRKQKP